MQQLPLLTLFKVKEAVMNQDYPCGLDTTA
jgi:hypothetical protein